MSSSPSSSSTTRSGRVRRAPAAFGNSVSSAQAYGSDDEEFAEPDERLVDDEDESWDRSKDVGEGGADGGEGVNSDEDAFEDGDDDDASDDGKKKKQTPSKKSKGKTPAKGPKEPKAKTTKAPIAKAALKKTTKTLLPASAKTNAAKGATQTGKPVKPMLQTRLDLKATQATSDNANDDELVNFDAPGGAALVKPHMSAGGQAPTIKPKVTLAKKGGGLLLPTVSKTAAKPLLKSTVKSTVQSTVKTMVKPVVKPVVKPKVAGSNGEPVSDAEEPASSLPPPPEVEEDIEMDDGEEKDENEEKQDDEGGNDGGSDSDGERVSVPAKRKRSATSDSTPRKLAPAEKATPEMRIGIIKLFLDPAYLNKVDFKSVAAAFPDDTHTEGKLKRHWREVLGEDAVAYAKDGTFRGGRSNSKGGIETQHRLKIWDAVAKAYDAGQWAQLEGETGMTTTKLKRHFRDVLKKDIVKMINTKEK